MLALQFSEEERKILNYERHNHPHIRVRKKMEVLYQKSIGKLSNTMISEVVGVWPNTVRSYIKQFKKGGVDKLKETRFYRPKSELKKHSILIENALRKHPPQTIAEASYRIEKLTGIKRGLTQTAKFIKSLGIKLRKVGAIPAKALEESKKKAGIIFRGGVKTEVRRG